MEKQFKYLVFKVSSSFTLLKYLALPAKSSLPTLCGCKHIEVELP